MGRASRAACFKDADTITGATISSEAVISILNQSTERWMPLLAQDEQAENTDDQ